MGMQTRHVLEVGPGPGETALRIGAQLVEHGAMVSEAAAFGSGKHEPAVSVQGPPV